MPLDPVTGKVVAAPERVSVRGGSVFQWAPAWSPDGRELAYKSDNHDEDVVITVVATDTGNQRELLPDLPGGIPYDGGFLSWSRDGRSLLVDGGDDIRNRRWPHGAYLVDALDGEATMLIGKPLNTVAVNQVKWLADGRSVVYLETWRNIVLRDLETGDERRLYESGPTGEWTRSRSRRTGGLSRFAIWRED